MDNDEPTRDPRPGGARAELEQAIALDIRALTAVSEEIGHVFARSNDLRPNDFRALLLIAVADMEGKPLTAGQLGGMLGVTSAAVTYLVERMIASGHIRRETDAADRRKVILRYDEHGMRVAREFFTPVSNHISSAMTGMTDTELTAAHKVLHSVTEAMRHYYSALAPQR
ncbi:MarR family winged helix-turn-helix transcriptional regulator [Nocardia brasiliensis]|uniref:MarR family winged helix-turn-helix transcriptional regulator n=1 Tax=Nocardia brasiliensis TaxID=37326 RepID=UPI002456E8EE|nr:MarR family winged helix-turn-helix transcriptional regulator [Nocardia brasiliensis]